MCFNNCIDIVEDYPIKRWPPLYLYPHLPLPKYDPYVLVISYHSIPILYDNRSLSSAEVQL